MSDAKEITVPNSVSLTNAEQLLLTSMEEEIQAGLDTFMKVGNALAQIRDKRLYRASYTTFEAYCNERWGFGRSRASRLISAAGIVNDLLPSGNTGPLPENEAQARPLAQLAPDLRSTAWQNAVLAAPDGKPTAAQVQQVVDEMMGRSGRFDAKSWYPVSSHQKIVFNFDVKSYDIKDPRFKECSGIQGDRLNQNKEYAAYALVDPPDAITKPIDDYIKIDQNKRYPIDTKNGIIYDDPCDWNSSPRYYQSVEWTGGHYVKIKWYSVLSRWCDFEVRPAMEWTPPNWTADSKFQPGMRAICPICYQKSKWTMARSYLQWLPRDDQIWLCDENHAIPDNELLFDRPNDSANPPAPVTPPEPPKLYSGFKWAECNDLMGLVMELDQLLTTIHENPDLVKASISEEFRKHQEEEYEETISEDAVTLVKELLKRSED